MQCFYVFRAACAKRFVDITRSRTAIDWAEQVRTLVDERYPDAPKIKLVMDNLNTHCGASLYKAFEPQEARRILDRLEFCYTPKHGSWLNMAEIELSILGRQCLNRRIMDIPTVEHEVDHWQHERNSSSSPMNWQFKTDDARIKLKKLYPTVIS